MKRLILSSLSILLLSATILPTVKAEGVGGTGKKKPIANDGISQILVAGVVLEHHANSSKSLPV
jgi:hypothetical protein